ncbi:unnamed protein product [Caenorhabditis brenneri]
MVEFSSDNLYDLLERLDEESTTPLAARSPLFRSLFKGPMMINRLGFHHMQITINDKTYKLGIFREASEGRTLSGIRNDNKAGGATYDIDIYGMRVRSETMCKKEDVRIMNKNGVWYSIINGSRSNNEDLHEQLQYLDKALLDDERLLKSCMEEMQGEPMECDEDGEEEIDCENMDLIDDDEEGYARDYMFWNGLWMTKNEDVFNRMVRFYDKRVVEREGLNNKLNGMPSNYKPLTQLTISSSTGQTYHRFSYDKKLMISFRLLIDCLLSERDKKVPIRVNFLEISCDYITIPLPQGVKFEVSNMKVDGNVGVVYDAMKKNLQNSSFPLESLELKRCLFIEENLQHNMARTAKTIILPDLCMRLKPKLIFECKNENILLRRQENSRFTVAEYSYFLIRFFRHGSQNHVTLSLEVKDERTAANVLKNVHNMAPSHSSGFNPSASSLLLKLDGRQGDFQLSYMPGDHGDYMLKTCIKSRVE